MADRAQIITDPDTGQQRPERYRGEAADIRARQGLGRAAGATAEFLTPPAGGSGWMSLPGSQPYAPEERVPGPASAPDALPTPSRQTMLGIAQLQTPPALDSSKVTRRALETDYAKEAANVQKGGGPGGSSNRSDQAPTDPKEPKAGTGSLASGERDPYYGGDATFDEREGRGVYTVKMPDGRIIRTNRPRGHLESGAEFMPFETGMESGNADVVSGAAGSLFMGGEAPTGDLGLPTDTDRSAGWAARAALNEAFRGGNLSMDPRDVMDRRRFEEQETLRDQGIRDAEVEAAMRELGLIEAQKSAAMDPYALAEIEAQGKYGGALLTEEAAAARQSRAMSMFLDMTQRIRAMERELGGLDPQSAQAQALKSAIDRAVQERREVANIAMGFRINDPRQADAFTAMLSLIGGGMGAGGGGETGG